MSFALLILSRPHLQNYHLDNTRGQCFSLAFREVFRFNETSRTGTASRFVAHGFFQPNDNSPSLEKSYFVVRKVQHSGKDSVQRNPHPISGPESRGNGSRDLEDHDDYSHLPAAILDSDLVGGSCFFWRSCLDTQTQYPQHNSHCQG